MRSETNKQQQKKLLKTAGIQFALSVCVGVIVFMLSKSLGSSVIICIAVFLYMLRGLYRDYMKLRNTDEKSKEVVP